MSTLIFIWLPEIYLFLLGLSFIGPAHLKSGLVYLQYRPPQGKRYCEQQLSIMIIYNCTWSILIQ